MAKVHDSSWMEVVVPPWKEASAEAGVVVAAVVSAEVHPWLVMGLDSSWMVVVVVRHPWQAKDLDAWPLAPEYYPPILASAHVESVVARRY